jgi:hypothetical protein
MKPTDFSTSLKQPKSLPEPVVAAFVPNAPIMGQRKNEARSLFGLTLHSVHLARMACCLNVRFGKICCNGALLLHLMVT